MSPIDFIKDSMFHVLNASHTHTHTHFDYEQDFHMSFKSIEKSSSNKKNNHILLMRWSIQPIFKGPKPMAHACLWLHE